MTTQDNNLGKALYSAYEQEFIGADARTDWDSLAPDIQEKWSRVGTNVGKVANSAQQQSQQQPQQNPQQR